MAEPSGQDRYNWVSYWTNRYGNASYSPLTITSSQRKINSITIVLGNVTAGFNSSGTTCPTGTGNTVKGAIWLNKPSGRPTVGGNNDPSYVTSTNYQVSAGGTTSSTFYAFGSITFDFGGIVLPEGTTTIYAGFIRYDGTDSSTANVAFNRNRNSYSAYWNTSSWTTWNTRALYFLDLNASAPYSSPTISITSPSNNTIVNAENNLTVNWSAWSAGPGESCTVRVKIGSSSWLTPTSGGSSAGVGYHTFKPEDYINSHGNSFTFQVRRTHDQTDEVATASITIRTYSLPSKPTVSTDLTLTNANRSTTVSWTAWSAPADNTYTDSLTINGTSVSTNASSPTSFTPSTYSPFLVTDREITITVTRKHNQTSKTASGSCKLKVRYTPSEKIINLSPNPYGVYLVSTNTANPSLTWSYPVSVSTDATKQYGIVSRYKIVLQPQRMLLPNLTYYSSTASFSIPKEDMHPMTWYTLVIYAEYNSGTNTGTGPEYLVASYIIKVSKLKTPVITYPVTGNAWNGIGFRIGFALPEDPDYDQMLEELNQQYAYYDVELKINGITISLRTNDVGSSTLFSEFSYMKKIVVNPLLYSSWKAQDNSANYVMQVRVRKTPVEGINSELWSDWSSETTITNRAITTFTTPVASFILKSQVTSLQSNVNYHRLAYARTALNINFDYINRSDYVSFYNGLKDIIDLINNYADYDDTRVNVKFPTLPTFTPLEEMIMGVDNYLLDTITWLKVIATKN